MDLVDFYYYNQGEDPTVEERIATEKTFAFLKDNNYKEEDLFSLIAYLPPKRKLTPNDLPDFLWNESLAKKNTFYYHNELHIISPAPYWDFENNEIISSKFFLEMKIKYTIENLISYFYRKFPLDITLIDDKKDRGSMEYLLNKYKNIGIIEPLDFVLFLIDEAANETDSLEIIELKRFEKQTLEYLKSKTSNAKAEKMNEIVWR